MENDIHNTVTCAANDRAWILSKASFVFIWRIFDIMCVQPTVSMDSTWEVNVLLQKIHVHILLYVHV